MPNFKSGAFSVFWKSSNVLPGFFALKSSTFFK